MDMDIDLIFKNYIKLKAKEIINIHVRFLNFRKIYEKLMNSKILIDFFFWRKDSQLHASFIKKIN